MALRYSSLLLALCIGLSFSLSACGYTFRGESTLLPADIQKVYIAPVDNQTVESRLTSQVRSAVEERFDRYGQFLLVGSPNEADAILRLAIKKLTRRSATVTERTEIALQNELTVEADGSLVASDGRNLWSATGMTARSTAAASSDTVVASSVDFAESGIGGDNLSKLGDRELSRNQEGLALTHVAQDLASQVYENAIAPQF